MLLELDELYDFCQLLTHAYCCGTSLQLLDEGLGVFEIGDGVAGDVMVETVKEVSTPFDTMLNLIREIPECAHRH